jgi:hypothetical protein
MQLDIFEHSRGTVLRNDVLDALLRADAAEALAARQRLRAEYPHDDALAPMALLIGALQQHTAADSADAFVDHDALRAVRLALSGEVEAAASRLFGAAAAAEWLRPFWRAAATRAAPLAFVAARSDDHAAPLWLGIGDWAQAVAAVDRIESWRRIPAPLAWMVEARCRLGAAQPRDGALEAGGGLLAELAWLSPARFDGVARRLADPTLNRLRRKFDASFEGAADAGSSADDLAWFPAWVLTEEPAHARWLGQAQPGPHTSPERAMRLMLDLLNLEHQGRHHDLVARRKQLRDLQPSLYQAYIKTR